MDKNQLTRRRLTRWHWMPILPKMLTIFIVPAIISYWMFSSTAAAQTTGTDSFQIRIPKKPSFAISQIKAIVTLNDDASVTFTIEDPEGNSQSVGPLSFNDPAAVADFPLPSGLPAGTSQDSVIIEPPSGPPGEPVESIRRYRYVINIYPNTNTSFSGGTCSDVMPGSEEFFTIRVGAADPQITGVCLVSFDYNTAGAECSDYSPIDPDTDPAVATVVGFPSTVACEQFRPAVDAVLVLDKSGSMNNSTLGGETETKIEALRDAVRDFIDVWESLRATEGPFAPAGDRIGLVFFDSDAHWMDELGVTGWSGVADGLNNFDAIKNTIRSHIDDVSAAGSTSMGDGLTAAANAFDLGNDHSKVALVMSNGKENTTLRVKVDDASDPQQVETYTSGNPAGAAPLPHQDHFRIYAVTVGTSTAVSPDINEDIARATGGFYINSEDDADLLRTFFLEILQNFVKFNTWETFRLVSERVSRTQNSYMFDFPVSTTTRAFSFNLLWNRRLAVLRLTLTPPGGGPPIVKTSQEAIRFNVILPPEYPYDPLGEWNAKIELIDPIGNANEVPFNVVILGDDLALKSELSVVEADYEPGDLIHLQARVTSLGKPLLNLGSNPADRTIVRLVKPGVGIGDLLSESTASPEEPTPSDPTTPSEALLYNELQKNPQHLVRESETVTLFDNGNSANGDEKAGDGIYSGVYRADVAGHYNFLFALEGRSANTGFFSRQQLKTVHVRYVPDEDNTEISTRIDPSANGNTMVIDFTPKTVFGNRFGPGWGSYFWFTAPDRKPFKARDNMDGTYTASFVYGTGDPPPVALHFLRVSSVIEDEVTFDKLPVDLDNETVWIPDVEKKPCECFDFRCHIRRSMQ